MRFFNITFESLADTMSIQRRNLCWFLSKQTDAFEAARHFRVRRKLSNLIWDCCKSSRFLPQVFNTPVIVFVGYALSHNCQFGSQKYRELSWEIYPEYHLANFLTPRPNLASKRQPNNHFGSPTMVESLLERCVITHEIIFPNHD